MRTSSFKVLPLGLLALAFAGCSGSGSSSSSLQVNCGSGAAFCLVSCDLGCDAGGHCALTEVAENQKLRFVFSQALNAATVNSTSFSLRTASGQAPEGDLLVDGKTITFVPTVRQTASGSTFGFARNETYILTIAGGPTAAQGLRSLSGDTLKQEISCHLNVTMGIIDEDGQPPTASLVSPTDTQNSPIDATIVVRFSELIDTTAFGSASSSPIVYQLRRVRSGVTPFECDPSSLPIRLEGVPQISVERIGTKDVTVVSMRPNIQLPGQACVQVQITGDVRDLSGRQATATQFQFFTSAANIQNIDLLETFASASRQDVAQSSGTWSDGAHAGRLGGDGRHGSFDVQLGTPVGNNTFVWNLDTAGGFVIPANRTFDGQQANVTDGKFYFSDFTLPAGYTLRFTGTPAPQIYVRGKVECLGKIEVNAPAMTGFTARSTTSTVIPGQAGGLGGPGGGRGGQGGDRSNGLVGRTGTGPIFNEDGKPGQDVRVAATHAYLARAAGTGGAGSTLYPTSGLNSAVSYTLLVAFSGQVQRGGAGGGFWQSGGLSAVPNNTALTSFLPGPVGNLMDSGTTSVAGTTTVITDTTKNWTVNQFTGRLLRITGGVLNGQERIIASNTATTITVATAFTLVVPAASAYQVAGVLTPAFDPFLDPVSGTLPAIASSLEHFSIGGSGGGGGASHPFLAQTGQSVDVYKAGAGGSGGGGTVAIRAGNDLAVRQNGRIEAKGGAGFQFTDRTTAGVACPGGGGSGGSVLLQSGGTVIVEGAIDTSGGAGSSIGNVQPSNFNINVSAGAGSPGTYRLESLVGPTVVSTTSLTPALHAPRHVAALTDSDPLAGAQSLWRSTARIFPPDWKHYVMEVDVNNDGIVDQIYTDDPTYTLPTGSTAQLFGAADNNTVPVRVRFQGAQVSSTTNLPTAGTVGLWRDYVNASYNSSAGTLNNDNATGFRFLLVFNRALFPAAVVKKLTVQIRG